MRKSTHAKAQRRKENRKEEFSAPLRLPLRLCAFAREIFLLSAVLAALTISVFAQTPNDTITVLRGYIDTGRYADAEAAAKKFLLKTPDNGAVRHELAETFALTGRYTEAIAEFERAAADSAKTDDIAGKLESDRSS